MLLLAILLSISVEPLTSAAQRLAGRKTNGWSAG